jgi:ATP-dependent 26S proteasome regulatory subunit
VKRVLRATTDRERLLFAVVLAGYVGLSAWLWQGKDFSKEGPLAFERPSAGDEALRAAGTSRARVERDCFAGEERYGDAVKVVTAEISGTRLFACYDVDQEESSVEAVHVVDPDGLRVDDPRLLKPAGVWPHYAVVKSLDELVLGGVGLVVLMGFGFFVATRPRGAPASPNGPWWGRPGPLGLLAASGIGWFVIPFLRRVPRSRKARFVMWAVVGWGVVFALSMLSDAADKHDRWGLAVVSYLSVASLVGVGLGLRARPRLGLAPPSAAPTAAPSPTQTAAVATPQPQSPSPTSDLVRVQGPEQLPTFRAVGGMDALKQELRDTIGLMLAFTEQADAYRIRWNGILLHGRPGTGKTFVAQATAGEFGLNFMHVATGDLVSALRGESARNVDAVFRLARRNVPVLLFFDEFDSVALRRDDNPDQEARRTVNQLLQSLEEFRSVRDLLVMAATNDVTGLDPAVIRPGRFDRHIHIAFPDRAARRAILDAQLDGRPGAEGVDLDELARRTEGMTPAALAQVVSAAAMQALRDSTALPGGERVPLTTDRLVTALKERGGKDRPTVENWSWDRLVLPAATKAELREIAALAEDPDRGTRFGTRPPSGVLLYGPPGTGKTTVARVLAAEARCSFYPVSAADVTSKWLGESERLIANLFDRARENRPSIVFIDEIDAIAGNRGEWGTYDRQVNQLLQEIDGVESTPGVLVVGATNRKELLDPALLRGGRLSRHIEIPLPDTAGRRALLELFTAGMPLRGVDLDEMARRTEGMSGADLQALCHEAAMQAMIRDEDEADPAVLPEDVARALTARTAKAGRAEALEAGGQQGAQGYI